MANYVFAEIDPAHPPLLDGADTIRFSGGPASAASVAFTMTDMGISVFTIDFRGHAVGFDGGVINAAANHNLMFDDGSVLLIGGPRDESYVGTASGDGFYGGDGQDTLDGLAGDDFIQGNQGNDALRGGDGADTLLGGQGNDGIACGTRVAGEAGNLANGNLGDDGILGGFGDDTLRGGQGDDQIFGDLGNDWISGDRGDDTIDAGAGADTIHGLATGGGLDSVLDFHYGEGDRVLLDPGNYAIAQVGADTVITAADGGRVVLGGVELASLPHDAISGGWVMFPP